MYTAICKAGREETFTNHYMQQNNSGASFRIARLILKKLHGQLTESESRELNNWLEASDANQQLFQELSSEQTLNQELEDFGKSDTQKGWQRLQNKLLTEGQDQEQRKRRSWKPWLAAAATIGVIVTIGLLIHKSTKNKLPEQTSYSKFGGDVPPGTRKAELILGNGARLSLERSADSTFSEAGNTLQTKGKGILQYNKGGPVSTETVYNTLRTPNGGEYQLILEDGTKIWLNAASSLRYPVPFNNRERRLELSGEAYFEIAKNKEKPFIVVADQMQVQVLGTAFNINTYPMGDSLRTATLIEGKIKVKALNKTILLQPGEQIKTNQAVTLIIKADTEAVTAWKNGLFIFNNTPLQEVMEQLARWYDVKLEYSPNYKAHKFFSGEIKRQVPISKVLQMMEMTGIARFAIKRNTVTILPYIN